MFRADSSFPPLKRQWKPLSEFLAFFMGKGGFFRREAPPDRTTRHGRRGWVTFIMDVHTTSEIRTPFYKHRPWRLPYGFPSEILIFSRKIGLLLTFLFGVKRKVSEPKGFGSREPWMAS